MVGTAKILPLALLLVGLVSCGSPGTKWVGVWAGEREGSVKPGGDPTIAKTLSMVRLTIRGDGTFELLRGGFPHEGTVAFGNEASYLKVTRIMGKPVEDVVGAKAQNPDITLEMKDDGTVLLKDPADFGMPPVLLKRNQD